jgi:lactoylglutathione lyase
MDITNYISNGVKMKIKYSTMIVKDMDESIKFYTEVMDFKIDSQYNLPQATITLLKGEGETMIELIKNEDDDVGLFSIGIDVDDCESEVEKLRSKGVEITLEPTKITVGYMAIFKDPNGVNIVLIQHDELN